MDSAITGYRKHCHYYGVWEVGFAANMEICLSVMLAQSLRGSGELLHPSNKVHLCYDFDNYIP